MWDQGCTQKFKASEPAAPLWDVVGITGTGNEGWYSICSARSWITELRADAFNVFNHANFANPNTNINSPAFGTISSVLGASNPTNPTGPHIVQLALHLRF